jgi:hypothetical protein
MDINDHPLRNKFYRKLKDQNTNIEEFTHKCWGPKKPYTHHSGKSPIHGGNKTPEVKIVNLAMLTFAESPGITNCLFWMYPRGPSWGSTDTRSAGR